MSTTIDDRRLHDIYRMRDLSGRLLYIGVTNGGLRRFMEHAKDKTWWREVTTIDIEHIHCSRSVIELIEREAIKAERPLYNVVHNERPAPDDDIDLEGLVAPAGSDLISKLTEAGIDPRTPIRRAIREAREFGIFASAAAMGGAFEKMKALQPQETARHIPLGTLNIGDKVEHPVFGVGLVIDIMSRGTESEEATIAFERHGTKHLASAWAPLTLIVDDPFDFLVSNGGQG